MSDDIIRMAREADSGFDGGPNADGTMTDSLVGLDAIERFAALVAAAEREACAKVCETHTVDDVLVGVGIAQSCAAAIRARSKE